MENIKNSESIENIIEKGLGDINIRVIELKEIINNSSQEEEYKDEALKSLEENARETSSRIKSILSSTFTFDEKKKITEERLESFFSDLENAKERLRLMES